MFILQKKHFILLSMGVRLDDIKRALHILNSSVILYILKLYLIVKLAADFFSFSKKTRSSYYFLAADVQ